MSNVNATLTAVMNAGVSALAAAVRTSHKLEGQIFAAAGTVAAVAVYRIGKAWNQGETAEVKETKFANALREFVNHYIADGNAVYRDSDTLKEFLSVKRNRDAAKTGPLVRAYIAACKTAGLSKKEHAIAETQRYSKKIVDDMTANHAGFVKAIGAKENVSEILKVFQEFVADNYGTTYSALVAYFKKDGSGSSATGGDVMEKALSKLMEVTNVEELNAMIRKLQTRADELQNGMVAALAAVENAGRASDVETPAQDIAIAA